MRHSLPFLLLAIPTHYSRGELLKTSETIEFILDFSTGVIAGVENATNGISPDGRVGLFSEKGLLSL
jgi:hypothetical protein